MPRARAQGRKKEEEDEEVELVESPLVMAMVLLVGAEDEVEQVEEGVLGLD